MERHFSTDFRSRQNLSHGTMRFKRISSKEWRRCLFLPANERSKAFFFSFVYIWMFVFSIAVKRKVSVAANRVRRFFNKSDLCALESLFADFFYCYRQTICLAKLKLSVAEHRTPHQWMTVASISYSPFLSSSLSLIIQLCNQYTQRAWHALSLSLTQMLSYFLACTKDSLCLQSRRFDCSLPFLFSFFSFGRNETASTYRARNTLNISNAFSSVGFCYGS